MNYNRFIADLHIHTSLSQCAEVDMTPLRIIDTAIKKGLDIIAITDHNSAENTEIAVKIGLKKGITVLPSIEVTSYEEVHVLAIFGSVDAVMRMQEIIYKNLPKGMNDKKIQGYQLVVNEHDEIVRFNKRLLFGATNLSIKDIVDTIHCIGGLAVASHIDREIFSIIANLGFIPYDVRFDALEISYNTELGKAEVAFGQYRHIPWITSSDAHHLHDIGRRTTSFFLKEPCFEEICKAFNRERMIKWE